MALFFPLAFHLEFESNVLDVAVHPTRRLLASALDGGTLQLHVYDACDGSGGATLQLLPLHTLGGATQPACTATCFLGGIGGTSDSNGWVAAGGAAGGLSVWDVDTGAAVWSRNSAHSSRVKCAAPLGPQLLATGDSWGGLHVWDLRSRAAAAGVQLPADGAATDLCLVEGKDSLVAVSSSGTEGHLSTISLRQMSSPKVMGSCRHAAPIHSVATLHGGRTVLCGDDRGKWGLGRWGQLREGEVLFRAGHGAEPVSALVQFDDSGCISSSSDGSIRATRIEGPPYEVSPRPAVQAHGGGSRVRLALSGSGAYVASAAVGERSVKLWHTELLFNAAQQAQQGGGSPSLVAQMSLRRDREAAAAGAGRNGAQPQRQQQAGAGASASAQEAREEQVCIVCMEAAGTGGFVHGGSMHGGYCGACVREIRRSRPGRCPTCNQAVQSYVERTFS